jgi:hypothetical protein
MSLWIVTASFQCWDLGVSYWKHKISNQAVNMKGIESQKGVTRQSLCGGCRRSDDYCAVTAVTGLVGG